MATAEDAIQTFRELSPTEQKRAAAAVGLTPLSESNPFLGWIWLLVVGAFVVLMVGGAFLVFLLIQDGKGTEVVAPFVTAALGVLAGLLAPSPVRGGTQNP